MDLAFSFYWPDSQRFRVSGGAGIYERDLGSRVEQGTHGMAVESDLDVQSRCNL